MVDDMIRAVAEYLGRSGPWHQRFMELQEVFTATNLEVQGIHDIRWLSKGDAVARFVEVLPNLVVMLSEWKDRTFYELITSHRFQFLLRFLADDLELLNVLSKVFQQRERLYHFIAKHGPEGSPLMVVEGASSDGSMNRFTFTLHECTIERYRGLGHHDACVALCTDMAELLVKNLQTKLGDLDSLSGARLFTPNLWPPNWERHARQAQCLE
ncbi:unnamed protein product [Closterium sp. Naga37s-1]|nr:unnamed protein product [Closterium sp. Naga37s-1]